MRDEIEKYAKANVRPFGVNQAGVDSHAKYVAKFNFNFPLLSDPGLKVASAYGAVKMLGIGIQRSVVVIGKDGKVVFAGRGAPGANESLAALG